MSEDRIPGIRVALRCLALLRRLLIEDTSGTDLIEIIRQFEDNSSPITDDQLRDKLNKDIQRLRERFNCEISFIHAEKIYHLITFEHPLIDLPDDALRGLAFLQQTFSGADILHRDEVMRFLDIVLRALPVERAKQVGQQRGLLEVQLHSRDSKQVNEDVLEKISRACSTHQEIEFMYYSPQQTDGLPRRHRVEPYRYFLEPVRRHYTLEAFQLEIIEPYHLFPNRFSTFRLERITDLKVLPKRFVPRQHRKQGVEVVYRLSPEIARLRDVTEHIPDSVITYAEDGSAEVHAVSTNLFMDLRTLLHYGPNCEVIGGEEARRKMKELVAGMARVYGIVE